jgi:hypothetical protein
MLVAQATLRILYAHLLVLLYSISTTLLHQQVHQLFERVRLKGDPLPKQMQDRSMMPAS